MNISVVYVDNFINLTIGLKQKTTASLQDFKKRF